MDKNEQIEEMMKAQCVFYGQCDNCPCHPSDFDPYGVCRISCKRLYNAGYRKQSEWVSVEDRLSEKDDIYLVYTNEGYIEIDRYCLIDEDDEVWGYWWDLDKWVTHWMPLPKSPKD